MAAKLYFTYWYHQARTGNSLLKTYSHLFDHLFNIFFVFCIQQIMIFKEQKSRNKLTIKISIIIIYNLQLIIFKGIFFYVFLHYFHHKHISLTILNIVMHADIFSYFVIPIILNIFSNI